MGFTGVTTIYSAKSKASGQVENFPNQTTMDLSVKQGLYSDPKVEKTPSLRGDIVKNIALIYSQKGEIEKAKQAMSDARKANPDDSSLIIAEAELYLKTKDMAKYKELITEAAAKNPNDALLFYNLGVVSTEADPVGAEAYYKKALAINPDYADALVGIGALQLSGEKKIVDEMNKLTTSAKDNARFDVLKKKKDALYTNAIPYFEKAHKLKPDDQYVISVLAGLYQALERTEDYKAMKAKKKA
jgi:tetratricopeptide (TPR) repeat protein